MTLRNARCNDEDVLSSITNINLIAVDGLYFLFAESSLSYSSELATGLCPALQVQLFRAQSSS